MALHSIEQGRLAGYLGMQFNFVVGTNVRAVALWRSLGFHVPGHYKRFVAPTPEPAPAAVKSEPRRRRGSAGTPR